MELGRGSRAIKLGSGELGLGSRVAAVREVESGGGLGSGQLGSGDLASKGLG